MNHRVAVKKLSKTPAHRRAMIRNMLIALFREERIKTTLAKAKVLRRFAEKLITRAKKDGVHNRRMAARWVQDKAILNKLFTEIGSRYALRPGGYTSIVKLGPRSGDACEMVYIFLVIDELKPKKPTKAKKPLGAAAKAKPTSAEEKTTDKTPSDKNTAAENSDKVKTETAENEQSKAPQTDSVESSKTEAKAETEKQDKPQSTSQIDSSAAAEKSGQETPEAENSTSENQDKS